MISYSREETAAGIAWDCEDRATCDRHYVVRDDGTWWRAFHSAEEAEEFVAIAWAHRVLTAAEELERTMLEVF